MTMIGVRSYTQVWCYDSYASPISSIGCPQNMNPIVHLQCLSGRGYGYFWNVVVYLYVQSY